MSSKSFQMAGIIIKNTKIVNENIIIEGDLLIRDGRIEKVGGIISNTNAQEIDGTGLHTLPGIIDDQVHFREPGLTHKATIESESKAAIAGGVTSFMEMPNTIPAAVTNDLLEDKYNIANQSSWANYSFFLGVSNSNLDEVKKVNVKNVCGVKIFMGSSTGNLLVDKVEALEGVFRESPTLIATHCEDEATIKSNFELAVEKFGNDIPPAWHPVIRNAEGCYLSSSFAVSLAKKFDARLHILHISSGIETELFDNTKILSEKRITSEACVHHLYFNDTFYKTKGNLIKCNPAIKSENDRLAVWDALLSDKIDIIATDHAPHTWNEKQLPYAKAPSGLPLVQHSLPIMLNFYNQGKISLETLVRKMSHAPAVCFKIKDRGFIREGYHADLVLVNTQREQRINNSQTHYKCGWTPLAGDILKGTVEHTIINGFHVYENGIFRRANGARLQFDRI